MSLRPILRPANLPSFQQHQHRAAAARMLRRLGVGEDVVPLRQPTAHLALQHGLAVGRRESLAVDDADAAQAAATRAADGNRPANRAPRPAFMPCRSCSAWTDQCPRRSLPTTSGPMPLRTKVCSCSNSWPASHVCGAGSFAVLGVCEHVALVGQRVAARIGHGRGGDQRGAIRRRQFLHVGECTGQVDVGVRMLAGGDRTFRRDQALATRRGAASPPAAGGRAFAAASRAARPPPSWRHRAAILRSESLATFDCSPARLRQPAIASLPGTPRHRARPCIRCRPT